MDLGLKGKKAIVLAGSAGLGRGVAQSLAAEGCDVAVCGRDEAKLQNAVKEMTAATGGTIHGFQADVANAESLQSFMEQAHKALGGIDILVANAGGPPPGMLTSLDDEAYMNAHDLSFMSVVRACRYAVPLMTEQKWGRVIALTSTSVKVAMESMGLSNVYRGAVAGYMKTLALESSRDGIRAHTVLTGPFVTDRVTQLGTAACEREGITMDEWLKKAAQNTLVGRFGDPLEMGALVAFLASERAEFMTGSSMAIDGGALRTVS